MLSYNLPSINCAVQWRYIDSHEDADVYSVLLTSQIKEHLAKGQRTLAGNGMSQVTKTLLDLTQRKNFYAGDLLISVEILRNVTDTFRRASYIPASDGVQVSETI